MSFSSVLNEIARQVGPAANRFQVREGASVRVIGEEALAERLSNATPKIRNEVYKAIQKGARNIRNQTRSGAPPGKTGDLKASVKIKGYAKDLTMMVFTDYPRHIRRVKIGRVSPDGRKHSYPGARVYYSYVIEYGIKAHPNGKWGRPARPFFWRAVVANQYNIKDEIGEAAKGAARRV